MSQAPSTARPEAAIAGAPPREQPRTMIRTDTLGLPVDAVCGPASRAAPAFVLSVLERLPSGPVLVTFANPGTAALARRSAAFRHALGAFDMVLPDGIGLCLAMRWLHRLRAGRVSFDTTSLAPVIFGFAQRRGWGIALIGGPPGIAAQAAGRIEAAFPGIRIVATFDGFGEREVTIGRTMALAPDIVVCGMGAEKQERFLLDLKARGWSGWGFTCGGYLSQLQGGLSYYPGWINATNLRWAYRLVREPSRLWRRYLFDYGTFGLLLCAAVANRLREEHARA